MSPLLVVALVVFLEGLSFGIILPVLEPFAERLGGGETWAGILFAAATLPRIVTAPLWGRFSDRFGRRQAMTLVALGTTSASVLWALSGRLDGILVSGLIWLLISRLIYGLFAAQSVLGMAVASDVSTPARRAAAMGSLGAAFGLAFTIGPALGGWFAGRFGHPSIGWFSGALQAASVLLILAALRETRPVARASPSDLFVPPRKMMHLTLVPMIAALVAVTIISTAAYSVLFPTFTQLTQSRYGWDMAAAGRALSVFGLVGALVQGGLIRPAVRRLGEKPVAVLGLATLAAGLLTMALPTAVGGLWLALTLVAIGTGLCVPTVTSLMSTSVPEHDQGAIHGMNQSATSVGRTLGFAFSGAAFEHLGPSPTYAGAAIAAAASLVLLSIARVRSRAQSDRAIEATADEIP